MSKKMIPFKDRLCELMNERKWKQVDVASKLGYTPQAISKWVSGASSPSLEDLPAIAEKLSVSVFWLAGYPDVPMSNGSAMDAEMKELVEKKIDDQQVMDAAPKMEVNGSLYPVYTKEQLDKRMEMLAKALDMFERGLINADMLKLIVSSLR